jgi:beta-glucosidase
MLTPTPISASTQRRLPAALVLLAALAPCPALPQAPPVTGNPRVDALLSRMTFEEKMALIRGASEPPATYQGQAGYLAGVPRLGIPPLRLADGPPGVLTRLPSQAETSTMGLAATFSAEDAEQNGIVIAREARSLGIDIVLEPFLNIDRDITFSRSYNTEGEDPLLTGAIGAGLIRGIQGQGILAEAKHFLGYDTESRNVFIDPQALHEVYLAPFADAVHAHVSSIMCSYNKINGVQACGSSDMLIKTLRGELGFQGFVTSDWGAVHSPDYVNHGLDMEMPGPGAGNFVLSRLTFSFFNTEQKVHIPRPVINLQLIAAYLAGKFPETLTFTFSNFNKKDRAYRLSVPSDTFTELLGTPMPEEPKPSRLDFSTFLTKDTHTDFWNLLHEGSLRESTITAAAGRVLLAMNDFGYLDHPPPLQIEPHQTEANAQIIRKTAKDAAVLLKNDGGILPLQPASLDSLAMIGPGAGQTVAIGIAGERSTGFPERQIGTVQALRQFAPAAHVTYAVEDDMTGEPIPATQWTHRGAFGHKPGLLRIGNGGPETVDSATIDSVLDFTAKNSQPLSPNTECTWHGELTIPSSGTYWFYLQLLGAAGTLRIDGHHIEGVNGAQGAVHGDTVLAGKDGLIPTTDGLDNLRAAVHLSAGRHAVTVTIAGDHSNLPAQVRLAWVTPEQRQANHDAAIAAARAAKTAIVFAWSRGRPNFALPGDQNQLIADIAQANPNTIVVLNVSQPVALPWIDKVKAVLQMWWPGDEGGWATAETLLGTSSPAGRLPFTWARKLTDYAANDPRYPERSSHGVGHKTTFSEGVHVGYRWFDKQNIEPQFPFGYGLSYTTFAYSGLAAVPNPDGSLAVSFLVKNTGPVASDEVPQVYLGRPEITSAPEMAGADFPVHTLAGFTRIHLEPGASQTVTLNLPAHRFEFWSTQAGKWVRATGPRAVLVGGSSRDLPLQTTVTIP